MEVLQDTYKDTKIGRIPKDWEVVKIMDVAENLDSKRVPIKSEDRANMSGEYPYYGAQGIIDWVNQYLFDGDYLLVAEDGENVKSQKNDIAILVCGKFWVNNHAHVLRCKGDYSQIFLSYYLNQLNIRKYVSGSAQPKLNKGTLMKIQVVAPSLFEQQKIAAILSTVDEQISTTDKIIEKSKELKKGLMQRFFLNKAYMIMSLGEIEKTELIPIKLNALGKILTGTTPPTAINEYYNSEDYMFIGPADLGEVRDVKSSNKYISDKGFEVARKLPENAVMVVCIGATIGKIGLTSVPCATNQQVNTILPKEEFSATYLYYLISGIKKYLLGFAGDTATPQLNKTDFGKVVTFIHNSKNERTKIAAILSEADAKIEKEQTQKAHLEALKKGLMQQLLTGKKRVKV